MAGFGAMVRNAAMKGVMALAAFNRARMQPRQNPYLEGVHLPLGCEHHVVGLKVEGAIPAGLDGVYARNGPNPLVAEHDASYHWFLGDAMLHGVRLCQGRALWYRNRWVRSTRVSEALGEPPAPGARHPRTDTANTNVVCIGGRSFAIVEAGGKPVELGPELETIAHNPFDGTLHGPYSAHPHRDPATGNYHAVCYEAGPDGPVFHVVVAADGRVIREERLPVPGGPMVHDCAITQHNLLVFDLPVLFSKEMAIRGYRFPYAWEPRHQARVGVLGLDAPGSSVRWAAVEPCYVYHPCNAYEAGDGTIIVDVIAHNRMFESGAMGPDSPETRFERWTVDPGKGTVDRRVIDASPQEFPRFDERLTGRPYRHAWTAAVDVGDNLVTGRASAIYAHDLATGAREVHDFGPGWSPGEFVHIPYGPAELDGWLIGLVSNHAANESALIILDARNFTGPEVARVTIPTRIPPGFHGNWLPA